PSSQGTARPNPRAQAHRPLPPPRRIRTKRQHPRPRPPSTEGGGTQPFHPRAVQHTASLRPFS
ncbi:hypothetical protein T484DRAFT_1550491, partial [Baffinella frigidus]